MKKILLSLVLVISILYQNYGQTPTNTPQQQFMPPRQEIKKYQYTIQNDIKYRDSQDPAYLNDRCRLDIYYPTDKENFQTLIWYHGGGLTGGSKEIPEDLKDNGFAIIGVGYRLSPDVTVADCIDDAAAAAAWVVNHIKEYGGNPDAIYVSGHSAGGYLTNMIGLDKKYMAKYGQDPDEVFAGLIPFSGQVITHFTRRSEIGMKQTEPLIDEMSPLFHVRSGTVPILILSGDRELEMTGRYEENAYFWRMLKIVKHENILLYEFDGFNHNTMQKPGFQITIQYLNQQERLSGN